MRKKKEENVYTYKLKLNLNHIPQPLKETINRFCHQRFAKTKLAWVVDSLVSVNKIHTQFSCIEARLTCTEFPT